LDTHAIRAAGFRIVTDACNGSGAGLAAHFLERLGCRVTALNDVPDGDFPHSPEPTVRNMRGLAAVVTSVGADVGFLINADADRVGLVAGGGGTLSEEYVFPIVAAYRLESARGPVVSTLSTSRMVESVALLHKRPVVRARIGEGHVVQTALMQRAAIGGEGSGGVLVPQWTRWFDGFATMGVLLECLARRGVPLAELAGELPRFHMLKGTIPSSTERIYPIIEDFRREYRETNPNLEDGVRVDWKDAWLHVRASNTEPLIRVIVEAEDAGKARALFDGSLDRIRRMQSGRSAE
jgi:phosphomannomutase